MHTLHTCGVHIYETVHHYMEFNPYASILQYADMIACHKHL